MHLKSCLQNFGNLGQDSPAASKIVRMTIYNAVSNEITFKWQYFHFSILIEIYLLSWNTNLSFVFQLCVVGRLVSRYSNC